MGNMMQGKGRTYLRGNVWWIDYFAGPSGKKRRIREPVGPSHKAALVALSARVAQVAEGRFIQVRPDERTTFDETAEDFLSYSRTNKRSWREDERHMRYFSALFRGRRLSEVTPKDIEEFKEQRLKEGRTPATVNRSLAALKKMFSVAIEYGKATENPVKRVKLLRGEIERNVCLSIEQIGKLVAECPSHFAPMVKGALLTGMRLGELSRLRWEDVDMEHGVIHVTKTKSGHSREVPIVETMKKVLLECRLRTDGPFVFVSRLGKPYRNIHTLFNNVARRAGLRDVRFHDLRHTYASHLVMAGVDFVTVKELLGHRSFKMTQRYTHLTPQFKAATVVGLDSKFGTVLGGAGGTKLSQSDFSMGKRGVQLAVENDRNSRGNEL